MKKKNSADIFSNACLQLNQSIYTVHGNLYVNGDIEDEPALLKGIQNCSLEVFGDLYVDGVIYVASLKVHGNVYAYGAACLEMFVYGDIFIDSTHSSSTDSVSFLDTIDSTNVFCLGNITAKSICADNILAHGSITAEMANVDYIVAGTSINITKEYLEFSKLLKADNINVSGEIILPNWTPETPGKIIATNSISSQNIKVNCWVLAFSQRIAHEFVFMGSFFIIFYIISNVHNTLIPIF